MKRIYIRAGLSPLAPVGIGRAVWEDLIGTNSGNLIYQYSVFRALMRPGTTFDARYEAQVCADPRGVDRINEACDMAVIPLANAFRRSYDLKLLTGMIRRLKIPCVILGCGLQAQSAEEIAGGFPFDDDVRDFVDAALDKSALLGLRGEITADYLKHLGYAPERHFTVIGCPSLFLNGPELPAPVAPPITPETRFSLNTRAIQRPEMNALIAGIEAQYPNYHLVLQMQRELAMLAFGIRNRLRSGVPDATGYYPMDCDHPDACRGRIIGFTEARTWLKYMEDIDYSVGSRIHGTIAAVISGVPAFVFTTDTRTGEICRYSNIAHLPMDRLKAGADVREFLERADFGAVRRGHRQRFEHYVDFLNQNGVPHIFTPDAPDSVPFDEAMKKLPSGGYVRRGCIPFGEALGYRLRFYAPRLLKKAGIRIEIAESGKS